MKPSVSFIYSLISSKGIRGLVPFCYTNKKKISCLPRRETKSFFHYGASSEPMHSLKERLYQVKELSQELKHKTKSNASLYQFKSGFSKSDSHTAKNQRLRDDFTRDKMEEHLKNETKKKSSRDANSGKRIHKK